LKLLFKNTQEYWNQSSTIIHKLSTLPDISRIGGIRTVKQNLLLTDYPRKSRTGRLSQIRYSLVVILELNGVSEVQYKDVMMIDDGKYQ